MYELYVNTELHWNNELYPLGIYIDRIWNTFTLKTLNLECKSKDNMINELTYDLKMLGTHTIAESYVNNIDSFRDDCTFLCVKAY